MNNLYSETAKMLVSALIFLLAIVLTPGPANSQENVSTGQTVYVSIYSNVYSGPKKSDFELDSILCIRNTDPNHSITLLSADYYDNNGNMIENYIKERFELGPLASTHFYIKEYDNKGGFGANFIVKWRSDSKVNQPIIEGIMLGLKSGQGVSFVCPGRVITGGVGKP